MSSPKLIATSSSKFEATGPEGIIVPNNLDSSHTLARGITPLDIDLVTKENNYKVWSNRHRMVFNRRKIDFIITGTERPRDDPVGETAWDECNSAAIHQIASSLSDKMYTRVYHHEKAYDMWKALQDICEPQMESAIFLKEEEWYHLRANEGDNIEAFLVSVQSLAKDLEMSDKEIVRKILHSLPPSWRHFVTTVNLTVGKEPYSVDKIINMIRIEDMNSANETGVRNAHTVLAQQGSRQNGGKANKNKTKNGKNLPVCSSKKCGKIGHNIKDCWVEHPHLRRQHQKMKKGITTSSSNKNSKQGSEESDEETSCSLVHRHQNGEHLEKPVEFLIDSGSTLHCTHNESILLNIRNAEMVTTKNSKGDKVSSNIVGDIKGVVEYDGIRRKIIMKNVYYMPSLHYNLFSVGQASPWLTFVMTDEGCHMQRKTSDWNHFAPKKGKKFVLSIHNVEKNTSVESTLLALDSSNSKITPTMDKVQHWHRRCGHTNIAALKKLVECSTGIDPAIARANEDHLCESCSKGKITRKTSPKGGASRAKAPLELIHSDVAGPFQVSTYGGRKYFVTFIDDYTRYVTVYLMKNKSEVFTHFKSYQAWAELQHGRKIQTLRSDNGGEYISHEFREHLESCGIKNQFSSPGTPQQNGVAERFNRTLVEMMRTSLLHASLTHRLWGEALKTAVHIRNRMPTKALETGTPYQLWTGKQPNLSNLRVFGCKAIVRNQSPNLSKLDAKGIELIFVGYPEDHKAWRFIHPETTKAYISKDAIFYEDQFIDSTAHKSEEVMSDSYEEEIEDPPQQVVESDEIPELSEAHDATASTSLPSSPSKPDSSALTLIPTVPKQKNRMLYQISDFMQSGPKDTTASAIPHTLLVNMEDIESQSLNPKGIFGSATVDPKLINPPLSYRSAMQRSEKHKWLADMKREIKSMHDNECWDIVDLPQGRTPVGSRWVYAIKRNETGAIVKYKARLVAQGFTQKEGIDYIETFSPTVKFSSIRGLIALATHGDFEIHQMDVSTAYLNGPLTEDIYMKQPEGFIVPGSEDKVCKLKKGIYGLKQSGRLWYQKIDNTLQGLGFKHLEADHCVYQRVSDDSLIWIALYVDDLLIVSNNISELKTFKQQLSSLFDMKDLGEAHFILGIEIIRNREEKSTLLSQRRYIDDILHRFGMEDCKPVATPFQSGNKLIKNTEESTSTTDIRDYQSAVGAIMYAMLGTRPDLAYAITILSQFSNNPSKEHQVAIKRIFRYLAGTRNLCLQYQATPSLKKSFFGCCDSDWASDQDDRRSITGIVFMLANGAISWQSKKQSTVALSSVEAEYMASTVAAKEALWWDYILTGLNQKIPKPISIRSDSQGSIALSKNSIAHSRTKHIALRHHFVREQVENGTIIMDYVPTEDMPADILTKPMSKERHLHLIKLLGMVIRPSRGVGNQPTP